MIPETENPQEAKSVYLGKPARHAKDDLGRYITQRPQCLVFSRDGSFNNQTVICESFTNSANIFSISSAADLSDIGKDLPFRCLRRF